MSAHSIKKIVSYKTLTFMSLPAYRVGSDGSVWTRWAYGKRSKRVIGKKWKRLKLTKHGAGYWCVNLHKGDRISEVHLTHRLVLFAFVGPCPEGMECRHLDGDRSNANLTNLCWGTHEENASDTIRHGRVPRKLTEQEVREIRTKYATGEYRQKDIAAEYKINQTMVGFITRRVVWKWVE